MRRARQPQPGGKRASSSAGAALTGGTAAVILLLIALGAIEVRIAESWVGFLSGSAGLLSLCLLTASLVLGAVVAVPGILSRAIRPTVRRLHQIVAVLASAMIVLHVWAAVSIPYFRLMTAD